MVRRRSVAAGGLESLSHANVVTAAPPLVEPVLPPSADAPPLPLPLLAPPPAGPKALPGGSVEQPAARHTSSGGMRRPAMVGFYEPRKLVNGPSMPIASATSGQHPRGLQCCYNL